VLLDDLHPTLVVQNGFVALNRNYDVVVDMWSPTQVIVHNPMDHLIQPSVIYE
jgi:hypothetical protein